MLAQLILFLQANENGEAQVIVDDLIEQNTNSIQALINKMLTDPPV